ncbi:alpha-1,2-fucosyltransferase [Vibrio breoganii]
MIVVKVIGGLGNQLFQIAFAIALAKQRNSCDIYLDLSAYKYYNVRSFSADNLKLANNIKVLTDDVLSPTKSIYYNVSQVTYRVFQRLLKELGFKHQYGRIPLKALQKLGLIYNFDTYHYPIQTNAYDLCIYGYFQNENYFKTAKEEVISAFTVKTPPTNIEKNYIQQIQADTSIAVSMRLGDDYIESGDFVISENSFYIKALHTLKQRHPFARVFAFSDDIEKAKEIFKDDTSIIYIENCTDYQSLRLMSLCDHYVIANSSFSWWGAYLGTNDNKEIIAPHKWFTYMGDRDNIYTTNMEKL